MDHRAFLVYRSVFDTFLLRLLDAVRYRTLRLYMFSCYHYTTGFVQSARPRT